MYFLCFWRRKVTAVLCKEHHKYSRKAKEGTLAWFPFVFVRWAMSWTTDSEDNDNDSDGQHPRTRAVMMVQ